MYRICSVISRNRCGKSRYLLRIPGVR